MLAREKFEDLLDRISSDAPSPGSGSAAAAALALGIACLRKAIAISLKDAGDTAEALLQAEDRLHGLLGQALLSADADARGFPRLLAANRLGEAEITKSAADDLVALSMRLIGLCEQVRREASDLAQLTKPIMANDLLAASILAGAAEAIARANGTENSVA